MNRFVAFLISLALGLSTTVVSHAQVPMRALDPILSAPGNVQGWKVDPGKGALGLTIPVATVNGEIPIPVVFRYQASYSALWYHIPSVPAWGEYAFPISGSVHFGYIAIPTLYGASDTNTYDPSFYCVMEDGTQYSSREFTSFSTSVGSTFSLPSSFGFAAKAASAVQVQSAGTLVMYSATASDLGSWASKVKAPSGFSSGSKTGYKILMDRDKARVLVFLQELNAWVPVLWVDRFNHWVSFQWKATTTGLPSDISSIRMVTVLNHRSKGLQVQWAEPVSGASDSVKTFARVDFIGVQAPAMQIKGYADRASQEPSALGGGSRDKFRLMGGGPVLRPTEIRMGDPAGITAPSWMSVPDAVGTESWPDDLVWTFAYDTMNAELTSFTDALGVMTALTWQTNKFIGPPDATAEVGNVDNVLRSVVRSISTDAQTHVALVHIWTWTLPTSSSYTSWAATHSQQWSGSGITGAPGSITKNTFLAPADRPTFWANQSWTNSEIWDSTLTTNLYTKAFCKFTDGLGVDGTMSAPNYIASGWGDLNKDGCIKQYIGLDSKTASITSQSFYLASATYEKTAYTYERHPELLDPNRIATIDRSLITSGTVTSSAPTQRKYYDPAKWSLTSEYSQIGTTQWTAGMSYGYDGDGHMTSASTSFGFSAPGHLTQTTSWDASSGLPTGTSTSFDVPPSGTDSYTQSWSDRDEADRVTQSTDGLGVTTSTTYDARGRVISVVRGGAATVTYSYPDERTRTISQNGFTTTETYDGFGRLKSRLRGSDAVTETYGYDTNGNQVSTKETNKAGKSRTQSATYDALGQLATVTPAEGPTISYSYAYGSNKMDRVTTATYKPSSGSSFTTQQQVDPRGRTVKTVDPLGTTTTIAYDVMGNKTSVTVTGNGKTQQRTYAYNGLGWLTSKTEPETGTTTYTNFNSHGRPTSINLAGVRTLTVAYDGLGRLRSTTGGTESVTWTYAGLKLTSGKSTSGSNTTAIKYTYGDYARLIGESIQPTWSSSTVWDIGYGYDGIGRMNKMTYPDGRIVNYVFDDTSTGYGRIKQVTTGSAKTVVANAAYDAWGNRNSLVFGSTANDSWIFNDMGTKPTKWLASPKSAPGSAPYILSYDYDPLNHLKSAGEWSVLAHDVLGRLTSTSGLGFSEALVHDAFGNNISSVASGTVPAGFNNFTFNALTDNQIPATTTNSALTNWTHNAAGEALSIAQTVGMSGPTAVFTWDGIGRLASTGMPQYGTQSYTYLPTGLRTMLLDNHYTTNNRSFAYTSQGLLLGEYTGSGSTWAWKRDVIYLGSQAIAEIDAAGTHELHCDYQGTPRIITNGSTGAPEGMQTFGPYGEKIISTGSGTMTSGYSPLTGYTGHVQTTDVSGLMYMRGRYYSPTWHRFINSDRGADPNQMNQFAYVGGSPFMRSDPSGMSFLDDCISGWGQCFEAFGNLLLAGAGAAPMAANSMQQGYYNYYGAYYGAYYDCFYGSQTGDSSKNALPVGESQTDQTEEIPSATVTVWGEGPGPQTNQPGYWARWWRNVKITVSSPVFKVIAFGGGVATSSRTASSLGLPGKTPLKVSMDAVKTWTQGGGRSAMNGMGDGAKVGGVNYVYKTVALGVGVGTGSLLVAAVGESTAFNMMTDAFVYNGCSSGVNWDLISEQIFFGE